MQEYMTDERKSKGKRLRDKYTKRSIRLQPRVRTNCERDVIHSQRQRCIVSKLLDFFSGKSVVSKRQKSEYI